MSSANDVDGRLQEKQHPPGSYDPSSDQGLQTSPLPNPFEVPQNQSTGSYPHTTHSPIINHGYVSEQHPPAYNELYDKGNLGYNPGPQVNPPQPWIQPLQTSYPGNVVVTAQPQPTTSNLVFVSSVAQRNTSQGLATTSLVMAIIGTFCCFCTICCSIPGIIFASISLGNTTDPGSARTHAIISMTCTSIGWISSIIVVVLYFTWISHVIYSY